MDTEQKIELTEFINMMEDYDFDTAEHCRRVAKLVTKLCDCMIYAEAESLIRAAKVHDVGKILIPKAILHKKSQLDRLETLIVNSHAHWGYEILSTSTMTEVERQFVLYHHGFTNFPVHSDEGYLQSTVTKCIDNRILEGSLILQACDIYDAITSRRPYRRALSQDFAYEALAEKHIPDDIIRHIKEITDT